MNDNININELIDRYLLDEMSQPEKEAFEKKLTEVPILAQEVRDRSVLVRSIREYGEINKLRDIMNNAHAELDLRSLEKEIRRNRRSRIIPFYLQISAAASVALIVVMSTLYFSGWFSFGEKALMFTELKNDVKEISHSQRLMKSVLFSAEKVTPAKFSGTCFALSNDGCLATNYHLVKDLDSVYVVNISDSVTRYKAKLIYYDINYDLALLQITDSSFTGFRKIPYTFSDKFSELGESAYTLGYSKNDIVYGDGAISSLTGFEEDTIAYQVSIPVNPGNSGSPLISADGEILGVIIGKHSQKAGATYAVKTSYLLSVVKNLKPDSIQSLIKLPKKNLLKYLSRTEQIKKIRPFIFMVEVY